MRTQKLIDSVVERIFKIKTWMKPWSSLQSFKTPRCRADSLWTVQRLKPWSNVGHVGHFKTVACRLFLAKITDLEIWASSRLRKTSLLKFRSSYSESLPEGRPLSPNYFSLSGARRRPVWFMLLHPHTRQARGNPGWPPLLVGRTGFPLW